MYDQSGIWSPILVAQVVDIWYFEMFVIAINGDRKETNCNVYMGVLDGLTDRLGCVLTGDKCQ